jgi:hypothetical protein
MRLWFFCLFQAFAKRELQTAKNVMKMKNGFGSDIPPGFLDPPSLQAVNE